MVALCMQGSLAEGRLAEAERVWFVVRRYQVPMDEMIETIILLCKAF